MFDAAPLPPVASGPRTLQQSPDWTRALRRLGVAAAEVRIAGRPVQVVRRRLPVLGTTAMIARAGLGAPGDLRRCLGVRSLIVNAEDAAEARALRAAGFVAIAAPVTHAIVDIAADAAVQRAGMAGKWRNRLRRAEAAGLTLRSGPMPARADHWLFRNEAVARRAKGYRGLPAAALCSLAAIRPEALRLFAATLDGRPVAGIAVLRHGAGASYQVGWAGPTGRAHNAHNLLLWEAMRWLAGIGVATLDLGPCDARSAPGLARFKRGTGARPRSLGGTWLETAWLAPLHHARRRASCSAIPRSCGCLH